MAQSNLLEFNENGIYCPKGDFYIDPWKPVEKAIITHGHADHARWGNQHYLAHHHSEPVMRIRLGQDISLETLDYNETIYMDGVKVSLHPAGHILGSAQVRLEYGGEIAVASGDYKTQPDALCTPFEPVKCNTFITESTFGLPIFEWKSDETLFQEVNNWWRGESGKWKNKYSFWLCFRKSATFTKWFG